jgi:transcription elongation factor Elf1
MNNFAFQRVSAPWVDEKYAMLLSHSMESFRILNHSPLTINFRCPICGDSRKNKRKARGVLYKTSDGEMQYKCHNCGVAHTLRGFLKKVDFNLYKSYASETLLSRNSDQPPVREKDLRTTGAADVEKSDLGLPALSNLKADHPGVLYWRERLIPEERMRDAFWTDAFYHWVNETLIPGKFTQAALSRDCGRIVIPFRDKNKKITALTARAVGGQDPKYVAVRLTTPVAPFGTDRVDESETVYVVEGPIDSMFLPNSIAMGTSNRSVEVPNRVMVYDNEPRAPAIIGIMQKAIERGETVVVWPTDVSEKDINAMVMAGRDPLSIIKARSFSGLRATIELNNWRRDR